MTNTELADELEALAETATAGEWLATERSGYHELLAPDTECDWYDHKAMHAVLYCDTEIDETEQASNAALIVALKNNLPAIISALRAS